MSPQQKDVWNQVRNKQHRFKENDGDAHQIGWSRIDAHSKDNHWHIDEIQSDFQHKNQIKNKNLDYSIDRHTFAKQRASDDLEKWRDANTDENGFIKDIEDPKYKDISKAIKDLQNHYTKKYPTESTQLEKWTKDEEDLRNKIMTEAVKSGIVKPDEHYFKQHSGLHDSISEVINHLSHGHEDPQHMIHSAINALGRKLNIKSMSMDTSTDQARQSGLTTNVANNNDADSNQNEKSILSQVPIHQQQTYHKRPSRLGMRHVPKKDVLGEYPDDTAKFIQYMNLHKKLNSFLDTLRKTKKK
jgi:hypothetical protein